MGSIWVGLSNLGLHTFVDREIYFIPETAGKRSGRPRKRKHHLFVHACLVIVARDDPQRLKGNVLGFGDSLPECPAI